MADDLVERYKRLVATGASYAKDERRDDVTSVFEIYIGHFIDIGLEIEAELSRLRSAHAEAVTDAQKHLAEAGRLREAVATVASYAWRTDPPNANNPFTEAERFSAIKYHPTVKRLAQPHIELAEAEALSTRKGGE